MGYILTDLALYAIIYSIPSYFFNKEGKKYGIEHYT